MRIAGIRELRTQLAMILAGDEPVLVTRHGKVSGLYIPLDEPDRVPDDLRRELAGVLGRHLNELLERQGVTDPRLHRDFDAYRRSRR